MTSSILKITLKFLSVPHMEAVVPNDHIYETIWHLKIWITKIQRCPTPLLEPRRRPRFLKVSGSQDHLMGDLQDPKMGRYASTVCLAIFSGDIP